MFMQDAFGHVFETGRPDFHPDATRLTAKAGKDAVRAQARARLLNILQPGATVYTVLAHVSRSGMSRSIKVLAHGAEGPHDITHLVARVIGEPVDQKNGGVKIGGCGMDMGFQVVYLLGSYLWPDGTPQPHGTRNGKPDTAGGYALKQRWL